MTWDLYPRPAMGPHPPMCNTWKPRRGPLVGLYIGGGPATATVQWGGAQSAAPPEGTRSAPLLGAVYGSGPETATDSRSCSCALPLSDSTGLAPGLEARIRRRAATRAATSSATSGWTVPAKPSQADWQAADRIGLAPVHVQLQHGSHSVCPAVLLTRSTHPQPQDIFLAGLTLTPQLHAVGQGWRRAPRGAVHCPRPTCASRAVF
eukprot:scaffold4194_cov131-Isochrysis_galbana.AAC.7